MKNLFFILTCFALVVFNSCSNKTKNIPPSTENTDVKEASTSENNSKPVESITQSDNLYIGNWVCTEGNGHEIKISKNGKSFLVKMNYGNFSRGQLPATYDDATELLTMNAEGILIQLPVDQNTGTLILEGESFKKK